jgi:hypothetical protein
MKDRERLEKENENVHLTKRKIHFFVFGCDLIEV